ncbi:MAG: S8 family peptidase [Vicinamibacterales bacterium]
MAPTKVREVEVPVQFERSQFGLELVEVDNLVRASKARQLFQVDGKGLTVAVLDTGLRTTHVDFAGRVVNQRNFTTDNGGDPADASDGQGHGTNVAGIIAAGAIHKGMAPGTGVIPVKVLSNTGGGSFAGILEGLKWVAANREVHAITAVCMSLGDGGNYQSDDQFAADEMRLVIADLRARNVAVVVAAGNDYFTHNSQQGMGYPAIFRDTVSVGAVYDFDEGGFSYSSGAQAFSTAPDRLTPFSQRLHPKVSKPCRTDIFAPGAPVTSSGINSDTGESVQHGTSQATPVTVGVLLLLQQYFKDRTGQLPAVDKLEAWIRASGVKIHDGDDEQDNVLHTDLDFIRLDAVKALEAVRRDLQKAALEFARPLETLAEVFNPARQAKALDV